jgi:hypothetical protein
MVGWGCWFGLFHLPVSKGTIILFQNPLWMEFLGIAAFNLFLQLSYWTIVGQGVQQLASRKEDPLSTSIHTHALLAKDEEKAEIANHGTTTSSFTGT